MAKGKVHMGTPDGTAACNQRHRKLLPLLIAREWPAVT